MSTASARLRRKLDLIDPAFATPRRLLLEHPGLRELYPQYVAAGTHLTLVMIPLMEAALERARVLAPEDPVAAGLVEYLERHIPEELHGEEPGRAALDDLDALGVDTVALREGLPPANIASLIGRLFFWICHRHPVAILGFLELEAYHPRAAAVEGMIEKTGLPRDGFRQLFLHAELDVEHAEDMHRVLDSLPLEPEHEQLIGLAALQTMSSLIDAWLEILAEGAPVAAA